MRHMRFLFEVVMAGFWLAMRTLPWLIGPFLAAGFLDIIWWKLSPGMRSIAAQFSAFILLLLLAVLVHLVDVRGRGYFHFLRKISGGTWLTVIFVGMISASLVAGENLRLSGAPQLLSEIARSVSTTFCFIPTPYLMWRLLFPEGTTQNSESLVGSSPFFDGFRGTELPLYWRGQALAIPAYLLEEFIPAGYFSLSLLSGFLLVWLVASQYLLAKWFFRGEPLSRREIPDSSNSRTTHMQE